MRRRTFLGLLGLAACDSMKPKDGVYGRMNAVNRGVQGTFFRGGLTVEGGDVTPAAAFPAYAVSPGGPPAAPDGWTLSIGRRVATPMTLSLADLQAMPQTTSRIEHHCVEGWSATADWSGVQLSEIAKRVGAEDVGFVEFRSFDRDEDGEYYWSSWDRASAMHPQTMIALAMNGAPLTAAHGAPARLYGAVKLGYKNVKYLTEVNFLDHETSGYWEEQGYEWFAGT
jgi:DMSO/TMAO reductase YedYZ molybdopterin-dependent catalytic subunit